MLGVDAYGSDSDGSEDAPPATLVVKKHEAPKTKKPVRIVVDALPKVARSLEDAEDDRPSKKPRLESGKGRSSLLSMLPAPKAALAAPAAAARVLGGSGSGSSLSTPRQDDGDEDVANDPEQPAMLVPTAVKRAAAAAKPKQLAVNFFSLGEASPSRATVLDPPGPSSSLRVSSAPEVEEYEPPEPSQSDAYPGYYQMPDGKWAAYEPGYYKSFWDRWQREAMPADESRAKGFENVDEDSLQSVNALDEMAKARKDLEDVKNITKNIKTGPTGPRMNIAKAKQGSLANQRHQLSTLLYSAYQDREAIEEKIADARRNRKESGSRYGF